MENQKTETSKRFDLAFFNSKKGHRIVGAIVGLAAMLLIFQAGVFVGFHKALFSYDSGDRYYQTMEGKRAEPAFGFPMGGFSPSHGATGKIVSVAQPFFVVASPDNFEKTVSVGKDTTIRRFRDTVSSESIQVGDYALVLGEPDEKGVINAKFVRLSPMPDIKQ